MDKRFWGILIAVIIVLGGIFWFTSSGNSGSSNNSAKPSEHIEGQGKDGITLVEYGDYECPYCGEYYSTVKQVQQLYNTQIYFQFRNLPLVELHPNAFAGARAAEAASLQGKFWQMHDILYENQDPSGATGWVASSDPLDDYFVGFAKQIGLNISEFKTDFASDKVNNVINADISAFGKTGRPQATPSFFLDGKYIQPAPTASSFEQYINAEIIKKGFKPPVLSTPSSTSSGSTPAAGQSVEPPTKSK